MRPGRAIAERVRVVEVARIVRVAFAVVAVSALVVGCRSPVPVERPFDPRPLAERIRDPEKVRRIEAAALRLLPVEAWPERPVLRQRVRIEWRGGNESFEAVLQRRPGELALIGLGPMNLVGFRIALLAADATDSSDATTSSADGERIVFENRSGRALPFTPAHMLADVQRVFYPWPVDGSACRGCERHGQRDELDVSERRGVANLEERRFEIAELPEAGRVRVRYADWRGNPAIPFHVELENGWFGYRLTIETLEVLAPAVPGESAVPAAAPPRPSRR